MSQRMLVAVMSVFVWPGPAFGQHTETGFLNRTVVDGTQTRRYQVYVPSRYTATDRWPVILYLHGGGAQGDDGLQQTDIALGSAVRQFHDRWPALIVFPQVRPGRRWNGDDAKWALKALEQTQKEFSTDPSRVYLTGLSRGGAGAYYLAYRDPGRFAALVVVCGRVTAATTLDGKPAVDPDPVVPAVDGDPFEALATKLKDLPTWLFHGDADKLISVEESRRATAALKKIGGKVTYTEIPNAGHDIYDPAYRNADLAKWLFSNRRDP